MLGIRHTLFSLTENSESYIQKKQFTMQCLCDWIDKALIFQAGVPGTIPWRRQDFFFIISFCLKKIVDYSINTPFSALKNFWQLQKATK